MSELAQHIKEEEAEDLPSLEKYLDKAESEKLANSFNRTKKFVPTRSHPSAPDKPVSWDQSFSCSCSISSLAY